MTYRTRRIGGFLGATALACASALAVLGLAPASDAQPSADARAFVVRTVRLIAQNRYDAVWPSLHSAHKAVAPRHEYVECERLTPVPGHAESIKVERVRQASVDVAGSKVEATAILLRIVIAGAGRIVVRDEVHAVAENGRWTWILPDERFDAYRADRCVGYPADTPPWQPAVTSA